MKNIAILLVLTVMTLFVWLFWQSEEENKRMKNENDF